MLLEEDNPLVRWGVFGRQVEHFLRSDIGTYLRQRAQDQHDEAVKALKKANPTDVAAIIDAQLKANVADAVLVWLGDAIAAGESAVEQLKQETE